jgi:hypothetical protein
MTVFIKDGREYTITPIDMEGKIDAFNPPYLIERPPYIVIMGTDISEYYMHTTTAAYKISIHPAPNTPEGCRQIQQLCDMLESGMSLDIAIASFRL